MKFKTYFPHGIINVYVLTLFLVGFSVSPPIEFYVKTKKKDFLQKCCNSVSFRPFWSILEFSKGYKWNSFLI